MLATSKKSEQKVIDEIKNIVNQPIEYTLDNKVGLLNPTISIGKANIIKDEDVKISDMIQSADENMYNDKKHS